MFLGRKAPITDKVAEDNVHLTGVTVQGTEASLEYCGAQLAFFSDVCDVMLNWRNDRERDEDLCSGCGFPYPRPNIDHGWPTRTT